MKYFQQVVGVMALGETFRSMKYMKINLMEVDDGERWNIEDNTTGLLGHVSQINTQRIFIYIFEIECLIVKRDQIFQ